MHHGIKNIIWILFLLAWGCSKAPLPPDSENNVINIDGDGKGEISVTTIDVQGSPIQEAKVYLNGEYVGKSPTAIKGVPTGLHTLRAQKEGYEIYSETVTIDNEFAVSRELILRKPPLNTGQLLVTVNVDSAQTTITNAYNELVREAFTKEMSMTLDIGGYFIRCEKPGYQLVNKAIAIRLDSTTSENIILEKVPDTSLPQIKTVVPKQAITNSPVLISWETANANRVDIDYIENPGLSGKREVTFQSQGAHVVKATAYNDFGEVSTSDTIFIEKMPNDPPVIELKFNPKEITQNDLATINWHSLNATEVAIDYVPNPNLSGQWQAVFQISGIFIINAYAYGPGGTAHAVDTLFVRPRQTPPPTISLSVSPKVARINEAVFIQWNSTNANSVDVDFVPAPGKSGQWQTSFSEKGEIIINAHAYNTAGEVHAADTIQVVEAQPPTLEMKIDPHIVEYGQPVNIQWTSNGQKVIIDQGIGSRGPVGNEDIIFNNPGLKKITIVAYGVDNLRTIKSDTVRVNEPAQPELPVISLSVSDSVQVGQPATLEWHSMNAENVDVDYIQSAGLNGKEEIIFQTPGRRIISATAYNFAGQSTVEDTLYVVSKPITEQVQTIYVPSGAKVCAIHPSRIQSIDAADVLIQAAGYYRITAGAFYDSGNNQKNESFYLTVFDAAGANQTPVDANAGPYKVVPDDPGTPHVAERDAGMFFFSEGINKIRLNHYYLIADQYPQFVVNGPIRDAESIQILYFKLEYVKNKNATRFTEGS